MLIGIGYFLFRLTLIIQPITPLCDRQSLQSILSTQSTSIEHSNSSQCIDSLIERGDYDLLESYLNALQLKRVSYKDSLILSIKAKKSQLARIRESYFSSIKSEGYHTIQPAIRWREAAHYVFIQFIYSVNHNEPVLCKRLEEVSFDLISDNNMVHFQGDCHRRNQKTIRFIADITLEDDLNKLMSSYAGIQGEVGRYTVTLRKRVARMWNRLSKNDKDAPFNLIKWEENFNELSLN